MVRKLKLKNYLNTEKSEDFLEMYIMLKQKLLRQKLFKKGFRT